MRNLSILYLKHPLLLLNVCCLWKNGWAFHQSYKCPSSLSWYISCFLGGLKQYPLFWTSSQTFLPLEKVLTENESRIGTLRISVILFWDSLDPFLCLQWSFAFQYPHRESQWYHSLVNIYRDFFIWLHKDFLGIQNSLTEQYAD